jgi:hypothetical protein
MFGHRTANATSFESTSYVASIQIEATRVKLSGQVNQFGLKKRLIESGTDLIAILRCFLSSERVV